MDMGEIWMIEFQYIIEPGLIESKLFANKKEMGKWRMEMLKNGIQFLAATWDCVPNWLVKRSAYVQNNPK